MSCMAATLSIICVVAMLSIVGNSLRDVEIYRLLRNAFLLSLA